MMQTVSFSRFIVAIVLSVFSGAAFAGEAIEEIVVTADFRERPASELPTSISSLESDFIEEAAVQHFEELVNFVPNLNWSGDGHRARYFQIRGVGELEQYQGAPNPSVGFLVDDIDFSGIGSIATLFDLGSVEVLRGPQGSRYGANALGGLIYVRGRAPAAGRDGVLRMTVGDDETRALGLAFGGSLNETETLLFRLSAQTHQSNGFHDNPYLGRDDTNGRDETAARLALAFDGAVTGRLSVIYSRIDNGYDAFALDNSYTVRSDKPGKDAQESLGSSLRLDWSGPGSSELTSITALASSDIRFSFDADWGNPDSWAPVLYDYVSISDRQRDTLSQEFRYTTDHWLLGLYALHLEEGLDTLNRGEYYDPGYDWGDSLDYPFDSHFESTNVAGFAQLNLEPREGMRVTAGLRVERRQADYSDSDGFSASPSETLWGGELSVSRDLGEQVTGYTTVSRGYKAGGFNLGPVPDEWRYFGDEAMWTLEAGIKSSWSDSSVLLNASVFHAWREDQQTRASFQLVPNDPASFGFATVNVDGGRNWGGELELQWQLSPEFEVYASAGLLFGGFPDTVEQFPWLEGRAQAHAPRYTLATGVSWHGDGGWFGRIDVTGRDAFYFDVSHNQKSQPYALVNARFGYEGDHWRINVWGSNLADRYYAVRGFYFGNEPPDFPATLYTRAGDPRHVGMTIERRFY
jgi:outer membrane receptor protein involved in Fe transport